MRTSIEPAPVHLDGDDFIVAAESAAAVPVTMHVSAPMATIANALVPNNNSAPRDSVVAPSCAVTPTTANGAGGEGDAEIEQRR
ncbi:MAG: hypothetical protein WBV89_05465 [Ilumatobacter sp.]